MQKKPWVMAPVSVTGVLRFLLRPAGWFPLLSPVSCLWFLFVFFPGKTGSLFGPSARNNYISTRPSQVHVCESLSAIAGQTEQNTLARSTSPAARTSFPTCTHRRAQNHSTQSSTQHAKRALCRSLRASHVHHDAQKNHHGLDKHVLNSPLSPSRQ